MAMVVTLVVEELEEIGVLLVPTAMGVAVAGVVASLTVHLIRHLFQGDAVAVAEVLEVQQVSFCSLSVCQFVPTRQLISFVPKVVVEEPVEALFSFVLMNPFPLAEDCLLTEAMEGGQMETTTTVVEAADLVALLSLLLLVFRYRVKSPPKEAQEDNP